MSEFLLRMSSSGILPLVEKFPHCTVAECDQLIEFARTTPLLYGAWQPFKQLFKKTEQELHNLAGDKGSVVQGPSVEGVSPDRAKLIELMAVLLNRVDEHAFTLPSVRWRVVEETRVYDKEHTVSADGMTFRLGKRRAWDYTGWRLLVNRQETPVQGMLGALRRAIDKVAHVGQSEVTAFDFDSREFIYEIKKVTLANGELTVACGSPYRWNRQPDREFVVDVSDPDFIFMRGQGPKRETVQYMKRRARRVLRQVGKKSPELYIRLASELLRAHGDRPFNPALHWALAYLLFANSPRWHQPQAGRGPYKKKDGRFVLKRREEYLPAIWEAHPDEARALLAAGNVPLEANAMALKILRAHGGSFEEVSLSRAQLSRFLTSDLPVLQSFAAHGLAAQGGEVLDGALWAGLMLLSNARVRRTLNVPGRIPTHDVAWNEAAARVFAMALTNGTPSKKRRAVDAIVEHFAGSIEGDTLWNNLATFAAAGERARNWMFDQVREKARAGDFERLRAIAQLPEALRGPLLRVFSEGAATLAPTVEQAMPLVAGADSALNAAGWQVLAATAISRDVIRELWHRVWNSTAYFTATMHATAAHSAGAFELFKRADFSPGELREALLKVPAFFNALPPDFFAAVFRRVSSALQIERALVANDEQWRAAREVLLQTLEDPNTLGTFWARVIVQVASSENETLNRRILDDRHIAATFDRLPKENVAGLFSQSNLAYEPYLLRWLAANGSQLQRSDAALLAVATHQAAAIRQWGLQRSREVGLDLSFALRLLESGLPEPFALGREWFENEQELDFADRTLALCDSPEAAVRALGRELMEAYGADALDAATLRKLAENSDPVMQAWLAEYLVREAQGVDTGEFDRVVLRTRGRARRAKEAVKKRRDAAPVTATEFSDEYVAALLEIARGRTTRDREWALQQLAQAALHGCVVEGVRVVTDKASNVPAAHGEPAVHGEPAAHGEGA